MKKRRKAKAIIFLLLTAFFIRCSFIVSSVPDKIILYQGEKPNLGRAFSVSAKNISGEVSQRSVNNADASYLADVKLYGIVPVKTVRVSVKEMPTVVPMGNSIGVKLYTDGLLVVGISDFANENGRMASPARNSGIRRGDIVKTVNGKTVEKAKDFAREVESMGGNAVEVTVTRDGKPHTYSITPCCDINGDFKLGIWVRNSVAGIGTMTFCDPNTKTYGALGHGISDSDTEKIVPLGSGEVLGADIMSVVKGEKGAPGELRGSFSVDEPIGSVDKNTNCGIYGKVTDEHVFAGEPMLTASSAEIKEGRAQILTCVSGETVEAYDIEIQRISERKNAESKCMIIKVTDKNLLARTGGILQGMSGSPIIQNGKLVGAVTHVLVNDPTRGYGIYIENMLAEAGV